MRQYKTAVIRRMATGGRADRDQQSAGAHTGGGSREPGGRTSTGGNPISRGITIASNRPKPVGVNNSQQADRMVMDHYLNNTVPGQEGKDQHITNERDYWSAVGNIGKRSNDYMNRGNGILDTLGNGLAHLASISEMDPTKQALGASIDNPDASWGVDPLGAALTVAGMATGFPLSSVYGAGKYLTGYEGPMVAFDGNQYLDGPFGGGDGPGKPSVNPGREMRGATQADLMSGAPSALSAVAAHAPMSTPVGPGPTPSPMDPGNGSGAPTPYQTYNPYGQDYSTYAEHPEWGYFNQHTAAMAEGGAVEAQGQGSDTMTAHVTPGELMLPPELYQDSPGLLEAIMHAMKQHGMSPEQYIVGGGGEDEYNDATGMPQYGFWKTIKNIAKHASPAIIGAGTSAITGSDILGGLTAGGASKLFGNSWGEAALTGLGTGALSALSGISGEGPGMLSGMTGGGAAPVSTGGGGDGNMFDSALNWVKDNPLGATGGALAIASALAGAGKGGGDYQDAGSNPANDPAYAKQIRDGGLDWNRTANTPEPATNWYQYGAMPEWDFFKDENSFSPHALNRAKGGNIPGKTGSALTALHDAGGMADGPGGGQDDKIPVYLSAKEYVVPADVVSDLGDGNPDHGAKKLDKMRDKVRKQKGRRGFPPKAKAAAEGYL